jgi:hypothetical protein
MMDIPRALKERTGVRKNEHNRSSSIMSVHAIDGRRDLLI